VRPYIRATCSPDADSWVAEFGPWWIDPETGFPIPERAGVLRYHVRVAEKIVWADRPEDLIEHLPPPQDLPPGVESPRPISVTFIPASVVDNSALLRVNPQYLAWLESLPLLERERLLLGDWKIRPAAGLYFKPYWDLAATEKTELNDPDWTLGIKLGRDKNGVYWLLDAVRARANPGDIERLLLDTAERDGKKVTIGFDQDPGQAGKSRAQHLVRALSSFTVTPATESGDKLTRFGPFSSWCRAGNVKILRGSWNEDLFRVLEGFPELAHDDEVDACSGALEMLNPAMKSWGFFEYYGGRPRSWRPNAKQHRHPSSPHMPSVPWSGWPSRINALICPPAPTVKTAHTFLQAAAGVHPTLKTVAMVIALSSTVPPSARSCSTTFRQSHDGCRRQAHQPAVVTRLELNPGCYGRSAVRTWPSMLSRYVILVWITDSG
jgi:predicted phage terminase large subunit-like protein